MLPQNSAINAKVLLDSYYNIGKDGVETPDIISDLVMKNGYVTNISTLLLMC